MAAKKKAAAETATKKTASSSTAAKKQAPTRGKRKAAEAGSAGLAAADAANVDDGAADALAAAIVKDGGAVLARYRDPLFGKPVVFAVLPLDKVARTSFQRDVSESHVDKLVDAMKRTGAYLDPVIAVRDENGAGYHSPNGGHRLAALTRLGAKSVTALVAADARLAFKILALNTEKAHALKDKALEAVRMLRALAPFGGSEESFAGELEEPNLVTIGAAFEKRPRLAGGAYNPLTKRCDGWLTLPVKEALAERERRAQLVIDLDDAIVPLIAALKEKGVESPSLRAVLLSRIAPLPAKGAALGAFDDVFGAAIAKARAFDVGSIHVGDLAGGFAPADD